VGSNFAIQGCIWINLLASQLSVILIKNFALLNSFFEIGISTLCQLDILAIQELLGELSEELASGWGLAHRLLMRLKGLPWLAELDLRAIEILQSLSLLLLSKQLRHRGLQSRRQLLLRSLSRAEIKQLGMAIQWMESWVQLLLLQPHFGMLKLEK
jgi:hypothetical protein